MMNLSNVAKTAKEFVSHNAPHILTGMAVAGTVSTAVMAAQAAPKASYILQEYRATHEIADLSKRDILEKTWRVYTPTVLMGVATVSCIIAANAVGTRRQAALASAYSLAERSLKDYQEKVIETIGANKERKIKEDIAQDKMNNNPLSQNEVIFLGKGDSLCYDVLSGRYFRTDIELLKKAEVGLNRLLNHDGWASLNDFYDLIGLDQIKLGEAMGWYSDDFLEIRMLSKIAENGDPCLVLDYYVEPKHDPYR